ncbi:MAG: manganese efflux pump MntP family protein [Ignavibacteria bacterium]|nr:manganese efflux pump MntP family protein [Ignavibacteria bacterium]
MSTEVFVLVSVFVAFALALDAFSVAVGAGVFYKKATRRQKFRLAFHFGLFQFIMPIIGWYIGEKVIGIFQQVDHWIAFLVLLFLGIKIIWETSNAAIMKVRTDISRGWKLVGLSIATSLDALAVGFGLSLLDSQVFIMAIIIGIIAATMTYIGIHLGERLSIRFEKFAGYIGGSILILIGVQIVLNHLGVI